MDSRRAASMSRLALQYAAHQAARVTGRAGGGGLARFVQLYREDRLMGIGSLDRREFAGFGRCLSCGLCEFAFSGPGVGPQAMASEVTRAFPDLLDAVEDLGRLEPEALRAAEAICPAGVPLTALLRFTQASAELITGSLHGTVEAPPRD
ncbi:MAG: hypothetical protein ACYDAY_10820 [Candidatus Dormibacteria bacterium]